MELGVEMGKQTSAADLGAVVIRELVFSGGKSNGNSNPSVRLLRQAKNLYRDGIKELVDAAGRGSISVADAERVASLITRRSEGPFTVI